MKERGIIMSGDNQKLILEGRKTQTRRIITPQPESLRNGFDGWMWKKNKLDTLVDICPYGVAGDRIYVREKWRTTLEADDIEGGFTSEDDAANRLRD